MSFWLEFSLLFNLMIKAGVSNFGPLEEKKDSKGKHSHDKPLACRFVMVTNKSSGHRPTSCWIHVSGQWNLQILNSGLVLLLQIKTCVSLAFNVDVWLSAFCSSELVWHSFMQVTENQSRTAVWKRGWKLTRATQNLFLHQIEQILCLALLSACK